MKFPEVYEFLLRESGQAANPDSFLNPKYEDLHDPLLLPNMERARDRVIQAIKDNERITVFSDYDADGIPGAVVLSDFFKRINYPNVSFYIPHRHDEGFGLNMEAVNEIAERGTKLLITVDCGIADVKEVAQANKRGMDVIITDHHEPNEKLPKAYAIVDPKLNPPAGGQAYPFKELCGAALAYKLVQAIIAKKDFGVKDGMEKWSLDMVGIATLSDMVPLVGENRILAKFGLDVLRKSPRVGLRELFQNLRMEQRYINEDDIAFMITPRINAASRMGVPEDAFKLLATTDSREATELAAHLEKINNERKGIVASLVKDAKKHLQGRELREVIVIGNPEWRPALAGLVANSLAEEYSRPVFVWGRDGDGQLKGSCRSDGVTDLFKLMTQAGEHFSEYGGHSMAGGFTVTLEKLSVLEEKLSEAFLSSPPTPSPKVGEGARGRGTSLNLASSEVCDDLYDVIAQFAPFGTGNPKPVFKINSQIVDARQFGKAREHLELTLAPNIKAISFFTTPDKYKTDITPGSTVSVLSHLERSFFKNRPELRLRIVDITA